MGYSIKWRYCVFKGLRSKIIMEMAVLNLQSLYDQLRSQIDLLNDNIEPGEYFIILFCYSKCSVSSMNVLFMFNHLFS